MTKSTKDILAAVACLIIAGIFYSQMGELEGISRVFPGMLIAFIAVCGLALLGLGLLSRRKERREIDGEPVAMGREEEPVSMGRVALISLGSVAYVAVIPAIGFYLASAVFLFAMAWVLRDISVEKRKTVLAAVLFTAVLCLSVWGTFSLLLNVPTPESVFFQG